MNAHERIWKALNHEEADRVPTFTQTIEPEFIERYDTEVEITGEYELLDMSLEIAREVGYDSRWVHTGGIIGPNRPQPEIPKELESYVKEGSVSSNGAIHSRNSKGENWYVDGILKTPEILREFTAYLKEFVPNEGRFKEFGKIWHDALEKDIVPIPTAGGVCNITWASIGMDKFSYMVRKYPTLVEDLIKAHMDLTIEQHKLLFEEGIDMVFICDDYAQKGRLMMSPKVFDRFYGPAYKKMADNAHKHGAKFLVHSDGDLYESFPTMIAAGVDGAEPLEYEAGCRLKMLKEEFGDKITLFGNIPASDALCVGSVEDTIRYTKQCILDAAEGGGYILSQGANLLGSSKVANVQAMIETVKKYGKYPLDKSKLQ
jgi:uroporphyrinogen decarboxylase